MWSGVSLVRVYFVKNTHMKRIVLIVSVVIALLAFGIFLFEKIQKERNLSVRNDIGSVREDSGISEKNASESGNGTSPEGKASGRVPSAPTAGYKAVRVSDGKTVFSFEVPEKWLVETRHDGEKNLTVDEMRDFLATSHEGNISRDPKLYSDYADYDWATLKSLSENDVRKRFYSEWFPAASVSGGSGILYTDWNPDQVDFFIVPKSTEKLVLEKKQELLSFCKQWKEDCNQWTWGKTPVGGKSSNFLINPIAKDVKGNDAPNKGEPGGGEYFVPASPEGTLIIDKQGKGDAQYEKDFAHLIATLKFE